MVLCRINSTNNHFDIIWFLLTFLKVHFLSKSDFKKSVRFYLLLKIVYLPGNSFFTSLILLSQLDFFANRILLSQSIYFLASLIRLSHFLANLIRLSHFLANLILLSQAAFLANRIRLSHGLLFLANLILLSHMPRFSTSSGSSTEKLLKLRYKVFF